MRIFTYILASLIVIFMPLRGNSQDALKPAERDIEVDGHKRHYRWYLPANKSGRSYPVILAFHGGGRPDAPAGSQFDRYIDLTQKGTASGFIVVYPDGYKHSWNAGPGPDKKSPNWGPAYEENIDDVKFVKALIEDLAHSVPIDRHRIYATGMSNGSAMSYRLAVELSDQIAAAAGVVSEISLPGPIALKRPVPVMYFWGTVDKMLRTGAPTSAERARRNIETWKALDGCIGKPDVSTQGSGERQTFKGNAPVVVWTIKGMGHCWPGVSQSPLETAVLGPANLDVDASSEIIKFFIEHPLP
jgi:polyhydroxybutyrate depolymerase